MAVVFGRLLAFSVRFAWGIGRVLVTLLFMPLLLIGLAVRGLMYIAIPVLILVGISGLLGTSRQ
ncbi:MAG: hypothetical protein II499_10000 [Firmicutes bacterium]|nr:hypothetical protein [Bacillota bacterium]MBQ1524661.1 hypothetical protein [Bacillota bacterium]MBQ1888298.1 hypothetical protein [Bacillota bacterium]MBQ2456406.1 hypothetical protein [Bacillota bacterium]MBQ4234239.1 hypothetical protein [Bacillota bacterium]